MRYWVFLTKNTLFGYFWARILENFFIFEISTLNFAKLLNFAKKQKLLNLGLNIHLGIFGLGF